MKNRNDYEKELLRRKKITKMKLLRRFRNRKMGFKKLLRRFKIEKWASNEKWA